VSGQTQASGRRTGWLRQGTTALDTATGQVGEVQQIGPAYNLGPDRPRERGTVWLRPHGGGVEWEAQATDLRPVASQVA